jgi:integrase
MGRPPLDLGTYGEISVYPELLRNGRTTYCAKARYRDHDGTTRSVVRYGQTKGRAATALRKALAERQALTAQQGITADTRVADLADTWLAGEHDWAPNTRETYRYAVATVKPALGGVRLAEMRPAVLNRGLIRIKEQHGQSAAKTAKTVLAGMFALAVAHDAVNGNPARDAIAIPRPAKTVRALTRVEADDLADRLRSDTRALELDLPDLVEFMLGTGARIGEACAARDVSLDLDVGTWEINATVIRVRGEGLQVQPRPKTAAGWRVLALPPFAVEMIRRRDGELRLGRVQGAVFGSPRARALRDPSNTAGDLRAVLDRLGYDWVTSHVFRKTVATRLDEAGMSARQIADQLGHAKPSMTQDVYMGRRVVSAEAARILDR